MKPILKILDFICFRLLLVLLGLSVSEFVIRLAGYRPWPPYDETRYSPVEFDPELGWRPILFNNSLVVGKVNEFYVRTLPDLTRHVPDSASDCQNQAIVLGDSVIWGWGVNDDKTLANQIALLRPDWCIRNGGVSGYGVLQSTLWYRKLYRNSLPKIVFLHVGDYLFERDRADISWTLPNAREAKASNFYLPFGKFDAEGEFIQTPEKVFAELPFRKTFALPVAFETALAARSSLNRKQYALEIEEQIFKNFIAQIDLRSTKVVLFQMTPGVLVTQLKPALENLGYQFVECIDRTYGTDEWHLPSDEHPTPAVLKRAAECVVGSGVMGGGDV